MGFRGNRQKSRTQLLPILVIIAFFSVAVINNYTESQYLQEDGSEATLKSKAKDLPRIDEDAPSYVLWPNDTQCSNFRTKFVIDYDSAYLISYPRSGNTWLRYLVEGATGIFTGSVYNDTELYKMGYLGEYLHHESKKTLLVKTHTDTFSKTIRLNLNQKKTSVILLVRNPTDAVVSQRTFSTNIRNKIKNAHIVDGDPSVYKGQEFREFVQEHLLRWNMVNEFPLIFIDNLLVIFYEELIEDPLLQVTRIVDFFGLREDPERISCLSRHLNGPAKRVHQKIDPLTRKEKKEATIALTKLLGILKLRNIKPPPSYLELASEMKPSIKFI